MPADNSVIYTESYQNFLACGRELKIRISKVEVVRDKSFEQHPDVSTRLRTGFELPPVHWGADVKKEVSPIPYDPDWARAAVTVYRFGGRITYREVSPTEYEAKLELPPLYSFHDNAPA